MQIACPSCKKQLRVPETLAGKKVRCPGCATVFPVGDGTAEKIQPAPARARTRPEPTPSPVREEASAPRRSRSAEGESPPRAARSRRREEDDTDSEEDVEERPRGRSRPQTDEEEDRDDDERSTRRSRSRREADDYEDEEDSRERSSRKKARRRGKAAMVCFITAGTVALLMCILKIVADLQIHATVPVPMPQARNVNPDAFKAGQFAGIFGCGLLEVVGAVYQFMAAAGFRSCRRKGNIITAVVFAFLLAVLWGIRVVANGLALGVLATVPVPVTSGLKTMLIVLVIGGVVAIILNVLAAILALVTLNNPDVRRAFRRR